MLWVPWRSLSKREKERDRERERIEHNHNQKQKREKKKEDVCINICRAKFKDIMGRTQSKPINTHSTIIKHTSIMHES